MTMTLRAKETAHSTVRAFNDLVGEATDRIEDVLPKIEDKLPKTIEGILPKRRKRSARRRTIGAVLAAGVAAAIAFFALRSRRQANQPVSGTTRSPSSSTNTRDNGTVTDYGRDYEPAGVRN
jgi:hypothetical protein